MTEGREVPTDLKHGALALSRASEWDDEGGEYMTSHEDDEYRWAGVEDPKIVITTSRDPSSRLKMFSKVRPLPANVLFIRTIRTMVAISGRDPVAGIITNSDDR